RLPGADLVADGGESGLQRVDEHALVVRPLPERLDLPSGERVVGREADQRCQHGRLEADRPVGEPAWHAEARHARAVAVDDDQAERRFHPFFATTRESAGSAGSSFVIRQRPSSTHPASMTTTGASTSPVTRALRLSSTRSVAVTLPVSFPRTTSVAALTVASTTACSPMMSVSPAVISPRRCASGGPVPVQVYLPSISEPSSRKAPMRLFRLRHMAKSRAA